MKHGVFGAAILAAALLYAPVAAMAQARQNFTLVNETGYDIAEVYVSPHNADDWQEDVLGDKILVDEDDIEIRFQRATRTCLWDLKVVYDDDDSSAEWESIDLCRVSVVTIEYNRRTRATTATFK
jgi:hypothetical protein